MKDIFNFSYSKAGYRNELIFTNSTKFFKSKEVFSIAEIRWWLLKYAFEYYKIKEDAPKCSNCLIKIENDSEWYYFLGGKCCSNYKETEEYQFYKFYECIL